MKLCNFCGGSGKVTTKEDRKVKKTFRVEGQLKTAFLIPPNSAHEVLWEVVSGEFRGNFVHTFNIINHDYII